MKNLSLRNFRNYRRLDLIFNPRMNFIHGFNGQGKTNLIESIYFLSVNTSFRTRRDSDLVTGGEPNFFAGASYCGDEYTDRIEVSFRKSAGLELSLNGSPIKRFEYMGHYPAVSFSPDDLLLVKEGPSYRRRFVNLEASRLDPHYLKYLRDYRRALAQRNRYLKTRSAKIGSEQLLRTWDQSLASSGSKIIASRLQFIKSLSEEANPFFKSLTAASEQLSLHYSSTVSNTGGIESLESDFLEQLQDLRPKELRRGQTVIGPHLDDIIFSIDGFDCRRFASQGQVRSIVLALKMGQVSLLRAESGRDPLILLDDVFSELDQNRKDSLVLFLRKSAGQCFITSTSLPYWVDQFLGDGYRAYNIVGGDVKKYA